MVRRAFVQRSLVEVLLPDGHKLCDPALRAIDDVLTDAGLVDPLVEAHGPPQSRRRGRLGTPAEVVLRMLVLKHLFDWSFDECERAVRGSLVYRPFCRTDGERVPRRQDAHPAQPLPGAGRPPGAGRAPRGPGAPAPGRPGRAAAGGYDGRGDQHPLSHRTAATHGVVRLRERTRSVARRVFPITPLSRQANRKPVRCAPSTASS